jgi:hypothetical protein
MDHRKTSASSYAPYARRGYEAARSVDSRRDHSASGRPNPSSTQSSIVSATIDTAMKEAEPRRRPIMFPTNQLVAARAGLLGVVLCLLCVGQPVTRATLQGSTTTIDTATDAGTVAPAEFDLQGHWAVVHDPTAQNGLALQHSGPPVSDDQLAFAVHKQAFLKNAEISIRLNADGGRSDRAGGLVLRLSSPQDYYLIQMDARRDEIVFSRMKNGVSEEIADVDAEIASHGWHTLTVRAVDNEFTVSFDGKWVFTGFDKTLPWPGSVALWTKGDSVTRFDNITITPLAVREETQPGTE